MELKKQLGETKKKPEPGKTGSGREGVFFLLYQFFEVIGPPSVPRSTCIPFRSTK